MRPVTIDVGFVAQLYESGVPVREIAARFGCSDGPIYRALTSAGLAVSRVAPIDPEELARLYVDAGLPLTELARRWNVAPATIRRHLLIGGIPLRTHAESLQPRGRKPCPQSLTYRAYVLGFVWGDMAAERLHSNGLTTALRSSTTKPEQLDLIDGVFGPYGKVKISVGEKSSCVRVSLDLSFEFLLAKYGDTVPGWINGPAVESSFASGYIDAEGSFGIYEGRARFKLDSYDVSVHGWVSGWMHRIGVHHKTRLVEEKGDRRNGDLWRTNVNEALSLRRLVTTIEPFARHARRRETMAAAADNVLDRLRARDPTRPSDERCDHQPRGSRKVDPG